MFGTTETIVKKRKAIDALEAEWLADVAEYDRSGAWQTDGFFGTAAALRHACHLDQSVAQQYVSVGRRLEQLPEVAAAFADGDISFRHVQVLAHAYTAKRAAALAEVEALLVGEARKRTPKELHGIVRRYTDQLDGDNGAGTDKDDLDARAVYLSKTLGGRWDLRGTIDPVTGEVIAAAMEAEMARDLQAEDPRRMPQRRADALANICRHAVERGELGESHGVRPHVSIVIDLAELPWFGPEPAPAATVRTDLRHDLSATSIEFLLCDCTLSRILMRGKSEVLDLGRSTPTVSPAQWKALVARDRHCQAPGCRRPPADCHAHHKWHFTRGGPTDLDNLELLCWMHHRQRHIHDNQARASMPGTSTYADTIPTTGLPGP
jgi:5-methylcytosine-specific restriction endonuclease McrA